nr:hypothetical protein GCM10020093_049420 [Planobispora longispora]
MIVSWELSLQAAGKSPGTVRSYLDSVRALISFLAEHESAADVETVDSRNVQAFLAASLEATSAGNAHKHFRNLRVFFNWLIAEGNGPPRPRWAASIRPGPSPARPIR